MVVREVVACRRGREASRMFETRGCSWWKAPIVVVLFLGCSTEDSDFPPADADAEWSESDGSVPDESGSEGPDSEIRDVQFCDSNYIAFVEFEFEDGVTGTAYCGPATIRYEPLESAACDVWDGGLSTAGEVQCDCVEGVMRVTTGTSMAVGMVCHISPPPGSNNRLTVSVAGRTDVVTDVPLECLCQPHQVVTVTLPAESAAG
jgi:hypothetical protein